MNRSTFWMIKYMNGSVFSKARYMNVVGFEILARTPVPKLALSYNPHPPPPPPQPEYSSQGLIFIQVVLETTRSSEWVSMPKNMMISYIREAWMKSIVRPG